MLMRILFCGILGILFLSTELQAHRVYVVGGYYGAYAYPAPRVYYSDPWYHPNHVYIYNGEPCAMCYGGYPYYYYDPRFYYFH